MTRAPTRAQYRAERQRAWWVLVLAAFLAVAAFVSGCTGSGDGGDGSAAPGAGSDTGSTADGDGDGGDGAAAAPARVEVAPASGAKGVAPATPVEVTAAGGTLDSVTVTARSGAKVSGRFDDAKASWRSVGKLAFGTAYRVEVTAAGSDGKPTTTASSFSTAKGSRHVFPAVSPLTGTTVGVGMPIRVYFESPVRDRKAVLDNLKVTTSVPTEGAWRWFSDTEVHWRPRTYWTPRTQVALDTTLRGVDLGGGVWGSVNADRHIEFTVGDAVVSKADARSHRMQVFRNGRLLRTLPVSMGRPTFPTSSGPFVVTDKNRVKVMDSTTYGLALDAGGYRTKVEYATRISNGGTFVHSAPWSVADQGRRNVSHGCINLSPANAAWFFRLAEVGDVVEVTGTPRKLGPKDGDIYDWSIRWQDWAN